MISALDWLNNNGTAVQAVTAVLLLIVTGVYVVLTFRLVRETKRRPDLVLVPVRQFYVLGAAVVNVGNGPAVHPKITIRFESATPGWSVERHIGPGLLRPDQSVVTSYRFPDSFEKESQAAFKNYPEQSVVTDRSGAFFEHVTSISATVKYREAHSSKEHTLTLPTLTGLEELRKQLDADETRSDEASVIKALTSVVAAEMYRSIRLP